MFLKFKSSLQLNSLKTTYIGCFLFTKRNRAHGSGSKLWLLKVLNPWKQKRRFQRKKVDNAQQKTSLSESFVWVIQMDVYIIIYLYIIWDAWWITALTTITLLLLIRTGHHLNQYKSCMISSCFPMNFHVQSVRMIPCSGSRKQKKGQINPGPSK